MTTHKETIETIETFLTSSKDFRDKTKEKKTTKKEEDLWLKQYNKTLKIISEYDVEQIDFNGEKENGETDKS